MLYLRRGKTTSKMVRSWDTVSAGAFFPQAQLQVPEKEMRQHRCQHMVMPAGICAHLVVGHAEFRFTLFKALFHRPPQPPEPDKGAQGRARRSITDRIRIGGLRPSCPLDHQPDGALGQAILTKRDALAG